MLFRRRHAALTATAAGLTVAALTLGLTGTAQAATLFSDNFDDGDAGGWSKSGGDWSVPTDGSPVLQQANIGSELARQFAGQSSWTDYAVQARVKPLAFSGANRLVGIGARSTGSSRMYRLALTNANRAELQVVDGSSITVLGGASLPVTVGTWYTLRIEASGSTIRGLVNGGQVASGTSTAYGAGRTALVTSYAGARFDDVVVDTLGGPSPTSSPTAGPSPSGPAETTPPPPTSAPPLPRTALIGWATQNGGTTGGGSAAATTVSTAAALTSAVGATGPAVIRVSGTISCSGMLRVRSDKTILGNPGATIAGCGLSVNGNRNVIIRNLSFRDWDDDAINVEQSATNIWVDHNSFANGYDGAVDIKRGSDFVTVSWNRISNHGKSMLLGHSDGNASQDVGHLRVTYHHNFFDGSGTRHPRVRFGNPVHVYNNYYLNNEYGVASTMNAGVLVESNSFEGVDEPTLVGYAGSDPGALVQRDNLFVGSGAPQSAGSVAGLPYTYARDAASVVKSIVTAGAGAGRITV